MYWNDIQRDDPDYGKPWLPVANPLEDGTPYDRPSDRGNRCPRTLPRPPRERA